VSDVAHGPLVLHRKTAYINSDVLISFMSLYEDTKESRLDIFKISNVNSFMVVIYGFQHAGLK
jgi:hypothetical protein